MENNELLNEIRYVRDRVDDLHDRINSVFEGSVNQHKKHDTEIVRLQEQTATIKYVAGRMAGFVSAVVSAIVAGIFSFIVKKWFE